MAPNAVRVLARHHLVALVARWAARDRGAAADAAVQPASFYSASHSHGTDRPYGFGRLRFVPLLELLRTLAHVLVVALARKRLLEPVQELCSRIDLIVMLAFRKHRHLVEVFGEPRRRLRNMDKAPIWRRRSA